MDSLFNINRYFGSWIVSFVESVSALSCCRSIEEKADPSLNAASADVLVSHLSCIHRKLWRTWTQKENVAAPLSPSWWFHNLSSPPSRVETVTRNLEVSSTERRFRGGQHREDTLTSASVLAASSCTFWLRNFLSWEPKDLVLLLGWTSFTSSAVTPGFEFGPVWLLEPGLLVGSGLGLANKSGFRQSGTGLELHFESTH